MKSEYLRVFKAFSDERRLRILEILCEGGEECACVLLDDLDISQPTLSHHMKILCDSGIVTSRKVGKWNYYAINDEGCEYAGKLLQNVKDKNMTSIVKIMSSFFQKVRSVKKVFKAENDNNCCCCQCSEAKNHAK